MGKIDNYQRKNDNVGSFVIEGDELQLKINKRDLSWIRTGDHDHHYLPDFSDETDDYVALKCAKGGCIHGALYKKEGKDFMKWLEQSRKARTTS